MPLRGLWKPPSALARNVVSREAFVGLSHGRHRTFFTQDRPRSLLKKARTLHDAKQCGTLVVTQSAGSVISNHQSGLGDLTDFTDTLKTCVELQSVGDPVLSLPAGLQQRTAEWDTLRKDRITASAFGNALGIWKTGRFELWEIKLGLRKPFAGNEATIWGTKQEAGAVERYKHLTGNLVEQIAFKIYKEGDELHGWLGASPDGLIDASLTKTYNKGGILEVKCPHNKGSPQTGAPWPSVPYYYMPQAQGLLEIFDREWMDFYVWCVNGSSIYRIYRDEKYWGLIYRVMSEFWWGNIVPAKHDLMKGLKSERVRVYCPAAKHPLTDEIVSMSKLLAIRAPLVWKDVNSRFRSEEHLKERLEMFYSL